MCLLILFVQETLFVFVDPVCSGMTLFVCLLILSLQETLFVDPVSSEGQTLEHLFLLLCNFISSFTIFILF